MKNVWSKIIYQFVWIDQEIKSLVYFLKKKKNQIHKQHINLDIFNVLKKLIDIKVFLYIEHNIFNQK